MVYDCMTDQDAREYDQMPLQSLSLNCFRYKVHRVTCFLKPSLSFLCQDLQGIFENIPNEILTKRLSLVQHTAVGSDVVHASEFCTSEMHCAVSQQSFFGPTHLFNPL